MTIEFAGRYAAGTQETTDAKYKTHTIDLVLYFASVVSCERRRRELDGIS